MNTIQETKSRLRGLALALATILDNYGVNSSQQPEYNVARQELEDIISNIADTPPPAPVTVDSVVDGLVQRLNTAQAGAFGELGSIYDALMGVSHQVDALVKLANAHGEAQQAASAA